MKVSLRSVLGVFCLAAGLVLLARPWWTGAQERAGQERLALSTNPAEAHGGPPNDFPLRPAQGTHTVWPWHPPGPPPPVFARLDIPALNLATLVVDGATLTDYQRFLAWGPAHLRGTPKPGEVGNVVIMGHVDEYGAPFRHLDRLRPGNRVVLTAEGHDFVYTIQQTWVVPASDMAVVGALEGVRALTLFTCTGPGNRDRLVVRAVIA